MLIGSLFLNSCTSDSFDTQEQPTTTSSDASQLINKLVKQHQVKNIQQKGTGSLQEVINQIEATALQEPAFLQLVTTNYSSPKAIDIYAIIVNSDLALSNLNMRIVAKNYVNTLLNTQTIANLNTLTQTIANDNQLTTAEKTMLLEATNLHKQNILENTPGNVDDWYKKGIIGYLQGATQTKANAVLNAVIIKTIEKQN